MKPVRIGICVLIAFAVLSFGAVEEWSQAGLEIGATLLLLYWAFRLYRKGSEQIAVSPLLWPLATFAVLILAQIIFHTTASVPLAWIQLLVPSMMTLRCRALQAQVWAYVECWVQSG